MPSVDVALVGGGIVGLATAYRFLQRFPDRSVLVLEKESRLAAHQTGHNSGVLHSGIYYKPGSLRAINCRDGRQAMVDFCEQEAIPFKLCGKVIVAVDDSERPALQRIYERGHANGIPCEKIGPERLAEFEPHAAGVEAIHVPSTGIVDYVQVAERLASLIEAAGGIIQTGARVTAIQQRGNRVVLTGSFDAVEADSVVNCGGLHSDRVARLGGNPPQAKIVPFRGEYYELKPEAEHLCKTLIYPVPDPKFPFLGVHFTTMVHGGVECGPNAVLAFAREGYRKSDINLRDLFESLTYPGFLKLAARHWRMGLDEMWRSFSKAAFVRALQRLMPEITADQLVPAPAGVRAQALAPDGQLVDDFLILESDRLVNICNAPSPAATASLNIGQIIVDRLRNRFER